MYSIDEILDIVEDHNLLIEMSTIGRYDNHKVMVYTEPQGNPSFHVRYKTEWEVVLEISTLRILEVKRGDFKKGDQLPNKELKGLIEFLTSKSSVLSEVSNWKFMVAQWNVLNEKYVININTVIPKVS